MSLGYRLALDDLGAGYAGLNSFAILQPEFVKLDRTLIERCHESPIKQRVISSMTRICREMGIQARRMTARLTGRPTEVK